MTVQFFFHQRNINLAARTRLKHFIDNVFKKEGFALVQLNYIFCSDDFLLDINRKHLQHDFYTDIITFDLSEKKRSVIGEIYISTDRVKENARELRVTQKAELHRVIFHGALHLCGYKDKSPRDIKQMRAAEDKYLKLYFQERL